MYVHLSRFIKERP